MPALTNEQRIESLETGLQKLATEAERLAKEERKAADELKDLESKDPTQKLQQGQALAFQDKKEAMLKRYTKFKNYAENCRKNGLHRIQNTTDGLEALQALMEYLIGLFLGRMIEKIAAAKTLEDLNKITPGSVMREVTRDTLNEIFHKDKFGDKVKPVMEGVLKGTMLPAALMGRTADIVGNSVNALINGEPNTAAYQKLLKTTSDKLKKVRGELEDNRSSQEEMRAKIASLRSGGDGAEPEPPRDDHSGHTP